MSSTFRPAAISLQTFSVLLPLPPLSTLRIGGAEKEKKICWRRRKTDLAGCGGGGGRREITTTTTTFSSSSSSSSSTATTTTSSHIQTSLKSLNKASYKISKPLPKNLNSNPARPSTPPTAINIGGAPPRQSLPPLYNIDKNDFRDVVQKLINPPHTTTPTWWRRLLLPLPQLTPPSPPTSIASARHPSSGTPTPSTYPRAPAPGRLRRRHLDAAPTLPATTLSHR